MTSIGRIGNNSGLGLSAGNATEQASDAVILFRAWLDRGTQCTQGTSTHGCIFTHDVRQQARQHCNTANMSRTHSAKTNWAVTERRLCPWCCHLGSYFYCASFTYHYIRWGIMCKHDIMNIQHSTVNMHDIRWYDIMPSVLSHCWLGGRKGMWPVKTEWQGAGMVICLEWGADLHMAKLMPLPLTDLLQVRSGLVLRFWYRLTWVVPEKGQLYGCVCHYDMECGLVGPDCEKKAHQPLHR